MLMSQTGYKGFRPEELEFQYDPRTSVAEYPELAKKRAADSQKVRSSLKSWLDVPYGRSPREILDIYPAANPGGPVLVHYHGGYWRGGSKEDNCGFAPAFVERGVNVVIVEYDLCPKVTVTEIVRQARASVAWIYRNIERYNGAPSKLYISGHSAGGQLGAMILAHDWQREGLPRDLIKGAALTSGVYDLEMVMHIHVNDEIRMTPELVEENSPFLHPPARMCPVIVGVGGAEPEGWQRMSKEFFQLCKERGLDCQYLVVPAANHFTLSEHLADPGSALTQAMFKQMGV
jgi:arylformamidase